MSIFMKNLLNQVRHILVLKNTAVCGLAQKPQPRDHRGAIGRRIAVALHLDEAIDKAIPITLRTVRESNGDSDILTDDFFVRDGRIFRGEFEFKCRQAGELLTSTKAAKE